MRSLLLAAAAAGAALAALVHLGEIGPHAAALPLLGACFAASVVFGLGWLAALGARGPRPLLLAMGAAGHGAMLVVGAWSRSGLPWPEQEPVSGPWLVAMACEAATVAGCVLLLAASRVLTPGRR
jgi:hypothetical protein